MHAVSLGSEKEVFTLQSEERKDAELRVKRTSFTFMKIYVPDFMFNLVICNVNGT